MSVECWNRTSYPGPWHPYFVPVHRGHIPDARGMLKLGVLSWTITYILYPRTSKTYSGCPWDVEIGCFILEQNIHTLFPYIEDILCISVQCWNRTSYLGPWYPYLVPIHRWHILDVCGMLQLGVLSWWITSILCRRTSRTYFGCPWDVEIGHLIPGP